MYTNDTTTTKTAMSQLLDRGLQSARGVNPIHLELAWIVFAYGYWASHIRRNVSRAGYRKVPGLPRSVLIIHAFCSLFELARYHAILGLTGQRPTATGLDMALGLLQATTSLWLTAAIHQAPRGELQLTRATFQCMALQRVFATGAALLADGANSSSSAQDGLFLGVGGIAWHMAGTKLLQNFAWARFILGPLPKFVTGLNTFGHRYTAGILGGHLLGMWEGAYPNGIAVYFGLMVVLLGFDRWAQQLESNIITRALTIAGFITRPKVEKAEQSEATAAS